MRRAGRDERGFSLVELLAAMSIGMVVLLGVFSLLDLSVESQATTASRVDGVQRGRLAMDSVTQRVRSLTCVHSDSPALLAAGDQELRFYSSLDTGPDDPGRQADDPAIPMAQRTLRWETADGGRIVEETVDARWTTDGDYAFDRPAETRVLAQGIQPLAGTPMFTYWRRRGDNTQPNPIPAELQPADLGSVGTVQVTFTAAASMGARDVGSTLQSRVLLRTDDPTDEDTAPECA